MKTCQKSDVSSWNQTSNEWKYRLFYIWVQILHYIYLFYSNLLLSKKIFTVFIADYCKTAMRYVCVRFFAYCAFSFFFCFYVAVRSKEFYTFSKLIAFDSVVGYAPYYLVNLFTISIYLSFTLSVMFICILQSRNCFITWIY